MKHVQVIQGSEAWRIARCGVVTASEADALLTPLFKVKEGGAVETYLYQKLAEKAVGYPEEEFDGNYYTEQGQLAERIALPWYNFQYDKSAQRVGFITTDDGRCGCSPDGWIEGERGLEIKFPKVSTLFRYLLKGQLPPEYTVQVHFSMYVTDMPVWSFLAFGRHHPSLVIDVPRDDGIQNRIHEAVTSFNARFDEAWQKLENLKRDAA